MKFSFKLFLAFYLPIVFAVGLLQNAELILGEMRDCRGTCVIGWDCASSNVLFFYDLVSYSGVGLIFLAVMLPFIMISRRDKKDFPLKFFK